MILIKLKTRMIANKLANPLLRSMLQSPAFMFSAKKKQLELTLRTPYRNLPLTQALSFKISQHFQR